MNDKKSIILMCPPFYYGVSYKINPWMDPEAWSHDTEKHRRKAADQWEALFRKIHETGAEIKLMTPHAHVPDLVFTANAATVIDGIAVIAKFKHAERQPEEPIFEAYFQERGFKVVTLENFQEGAGDALYDRAGGTIYMGYNQRSSEAAANELTKALGIQVVPLELVSDRWYHLDTCFCPLTGGQVMYCPDAFSQASQQILQDNIGDRLIPVSREDGLKFACNAVNVDDHIIMPLSSDELKTRLSNFGYTVHQLNMSEFLLAGGACKCLTLKLHQIR